MGKTGFHDIAKAISHDTGHKSDRLDNVSDMSSNTSLKKSRAFFEVKNREVIQRHRKML